VTTSGREATASGPLAATWGPRETLEQQRKVFFLKELAAGRALQVGGCRAIANSFENQVKKRVVAGKRSVDQQRHRVACSAGAACVFLV
jgi:hypothetical protein